MKSVHPPMYVLVAVSAFALGSFCDIQDDPESPDNSRASAQWARDLPGRPNVVEATELPVDGAPHSAASESTSSTEDDDLDLVSEGQPSGHARNEPSSREPGSERRKHGPILRTKLGNIEVFPADNHWNRRIDHLPVHPKSEAWIRSIGLKRGLHPDFGTVWNGAPNGIPYMIVPPDQNKVAVSFQYDDESDLGPYPIPDNPLIEGGPEAPHSSDRHIILIDPKNRLLYELFQAIPTAGGWTAGSGAIFDLSTNRLRPLGWTSADAAGLPVFPGLVRYEEVAAGEIAHALRFTVERTQRAYILPARHFASRSSDPDLPPMGLRVRLRSDYDISRFPKSAQVILTALKRYGMLLADNGSNWFVSGAPNPKWSDDELATIKRVKGRDLECVLTGPLIY